MMSYYEERVAKAKTLVSYAERGFKSSALETAGVISKLAADGLIDYIPDHLEHLLLEYEALKEVREDLNRAEDRLVEAMDNGKD